MPGNAIGVIDIMDRSTFVEVPEADAARVIEALSHTKLRGKKVYVDVARPRRDDDGGGPGGRPDFPPGDRDFRGGNRDGGDFRGGNRDGGRDNYGRPGGGYGRDERFPRPPARSHDGQVPRPRRKP